jgi:hypothetical protein
MFIECTVEIALSLMKVENKVGQCGTEALGKYKEGPSQQSQATPSFVLHLHMSKYSASSLANYSCSPFRLKFGSS